MKAGEAADDAQHEALGTRHVDLARHPLRPALQRVVQLPEQAQEVEDGS
jgi:hypothetical protein